MEQQPQASSAPQQALAEISGYYAIIPEDLIKAGKPSAVVLYGALDRIARAQKTDLQVSLSYLASYTNLSKQTVQNALLWLEQNTFIEIAHAGPGRTNNHYHLPFRQRRLNKTKQMDGNQPFEMDENHPQSNSINQKYSTNSEETPSVANAPSGAKKKEPEVSEVFRQRMHTRFGVLLGGPTGVNERIEEALNHKASNKWRKPELGVLGWLRREAERVGSSRSHPGRPNPSRNPEDFKTF